MNGQNNKRATHVFSSFDEELSARSLERLAETVDTSKPMTPLHCKVLQLPGQRIIRPLRRT